MDWIERMNQAIDYIEDHLTMDIDLEKAARIAGCSSYSFHRMFSFIVDLPLAEYIRRRRLTQAAFELQNPDRRILDVALTYGYESHESFSRAFQKFHRIAPSKARNRDVALRACSRITIRLSIKGATDMNYRIADKDAFEVFGIEAVCSTTGAPGHETPRDLWQRCHRTGAYEKLFDDIGTHTRGSTARGICAINAVANYRSTGKDTFAYMLCGMITPKARPQAYTCITIPALTWAILTSEDHPMDQFGQMQVALLRRLYTEWLPTSNYEKAEGPEFEIYGTAGKGLGFSEVWVPVRKRQSAHHTA